MTDRQAAEARATYSDKHPHEPEIPPALDAEGRCLICGLLLRVETAEAAVDALSVRLAQAEQERDKALRSAALREMETARASEYRAQLNDVTGRLVAQRRRLRELEGLQAGESSWQRERAEKAEVRLREYEETLRLAEGLTLLHNVEPDTTDSDADLTGFDAINCAACIFNVARGKPDRRDPAKVAASGGREAPKEETLG